MNIVRHLIPLSQSPRINLNIYINFKIKKEECISKKYLQNDACISLHQKHHDMEITHDKFRLNLSDSVLTF